MVKVTNKLLIAKNESKGNLVQYKQSYYLYFLPRVVEDGKVTLCEKLSLEIVAPSSNGEDVIKSYRMIDPGQTELLIKDLFKAWAFFKLQKDELSEYNYLFWHQKFSKELLEVLKDTLRGGNNG